MSKQPVIENIFLETKGYRRFEEFCDACIEYKYIGICYGSPGVGKTQSAEYYSKHNLILSANPNGYAIEDNIHIPTELSNCATLFYTPIAPLSSLQMLNTLNQDICNFDRVVHAAQTNKRINEQTQLNQEEREHFIKTLKLSSKNYCKLIIIDETERLNLASLELLRSLYDRKGIAIVFIGMPGLEKRLSRYPQLYSRIGFSHEYKSLSKEEMLFTLEHNWQKLGLILKSNEFSDHEAMASIMRITNGNFRLLNRLFMQIDRLLRLNQLQHITNEVVLAARECLLIGNT
ncbi:AAA family ATPase [Legionella pneumophila]|uniref:AAA family ATPase n=1 Tax=Legionella pneumophila TaxID=446 RepID=UPI0026DFA191|nr:AAA family ATPase [Legionella pneumophila]MDO5216252.1 AAA family ATPase [Legionella pneumophila]